MRKYSALFTIISFLFLFESCTKDTGYTDTKLSYSIKTTNLSASLKSNSAESGVVATPNSNGSINWTSASINFDQVDFISTHGGVTTTQIFKNLYFPNALKDSVSGSLNIFTGLYENINFVLKISESADNPPILIKGNYIETSGTSIPVEVRLNLNQSFTFKNDNVEIKSGTYVAKITVELNNLVKGLTAADFGQTIRTGANNTIVINSTLNNALLVKLLINLKSCLSLKVVQQ
nr:hypothetical protein [Pseudopedobacter sp.]